MKRFLSLGFLFLLCTVMMLVLLLFTIDSVRSRMLRLSPEVHTLFLGNSHFANGIDDTQIPGSYNWARISEHPEFAYAKAKLMLRYNPQIDTLFICFDDLFCFHNTTNKDIPTELIHPFYYDQFTTDDWRTIYRESSAMYWQSFFLYPFNWKKFRDMGGFSPLSWTILDKQLQTMKAIDQGQRTTNPLSISFINKTIELCRQKHVTVLLMCVPQYPHLHYDKESYKKEYQRLYSDIPFLDYMNLPMPDSCFSDLGHLSAKGARVFSRFLNQQLHPKPDTSE